MATAKQIEKPKTAALPAAMHRKVRSYAFVKNMKITDVLVMALEDFFRAVKEGRKP